MEHVTFDEFFDFVKNEDADWYIPGLKEYFEGLNQDEIYIQDNFLGKLVFQFNKFVLILTMNFLTMFLITNY